MELGEMIARPAACRPITRRSLNHCEDEMEPTTSTPPTTQPQTTTCALCGGKGWYRIARLLTRQGDIIEGAKLTCAECKGTGQTTIREL